jgi:hypothetical protein
MTDTNEALETVELAGGGAGVISVCAHCGGRTTVPLSRIASLSEIEATPPEVAVDAVRAYIIAADDGFPSAEDASAALAALSQIEARLGELENGAELRQQAKLAHVWKATADDLAARLEEAEAALRDISHNVQMTAAAALATTTEEGGS